MTTNQKTLYKLLVEAWGLLSTQRHFQLMGLVILMICASISEVIGVGVVLPFIGILLSPDPSDQPYIPKTALELIGVEGESVIYLFLVIFSIAVILSAFIRLLLLYANTKYSFAIGSDLSIDLYKKTIHQNYLFHISRSSSIPIDIIITKTNGLIHNCVLSVINLISSCILIFFISLILFIIKPILIFVLFIVISILYFFVLFKSKKKLLNNSNIISKSSENIMKLLQESLGGIREVILGNNHEFYVSRYKDYDSALRKSQGSNISISQSPRYVIEAAGVLLIAISSVVLVVLIGMPKEFALPILAAITLGAQRLIPLIQNTYVSWSNLQGSYHSLRDVIGAIKQPLPNKSSSIIDGLDFHQCIKLNDVYFAYTPNNFILKAVNITIESGDSIGLIGVTGGGKSTLIDLISGLVRPTSGSLTVDNVEIDSSNSASWWDLIAYVPQDIFLFDSTLIENIALGLSIDMIDYDFVIELIKRVNLFDEIMSMPNQLMTHVGERGVQLSGGQKQRIAIARALYKNPKVLILDEATSALDNHTESNIIESIHGFYSHLTIIMVAHRISTLNSCNKIYEIKNKRLIQKDSLI
ncbi:ABC transporter ATP-binding protein [Polynucleobacter sp. Adler-ghost]|uniref:ABC transporter ATP-binding protein n=1 Tax=Polynucleobacter sp. Adler-ghost TaxID=2770234 RepID=UPI001BFCE56B|nr:ABC transporter ATP-binding protein [Polynucleobacter sp. Adler-ghost]QWE31040.1 ABC transporter ATP-binding protein [Polynucleobacter sp. Adler-ghost]